jgi:hypothetical protein
MMRFQLIGLLLYFMLLSNSVDRKVSSHAIFPPERENSIKVGNLTTPTKTNQKKKRQI